MRINIEKVLDGIARAAELLMMAIGILITTVPPAALVVLSRKEAATCNGLECLLSWWCLAVVGVGVLSQPLWYSRCWSRRVVIWMFVAIAVLAVWWRNGIELFVLCAFLSTLTLAEWVRQITNF